MTRWIVFEGAPTVQEALDSLETPSDGEPRGEWTTSHFRLGFLPPEEEERAGPATQGAQGGPASAVVHPTTDSEGDVGDLSSSSDERVDQVAATPSEEGDLCDEPDPREFTDEYRRREISHDDVLDPTSRSSLGRHVKEEDDDSGFPSGGESRLSPEVCVPSQPTYAAS